MAAPDYVPVTLADQPRTSLAMPPARRWTASRPGDLERGQPIGPRFGTPGPDQGYALALAHRFVDRLKLHPGEHTEDVVAGAIGVALRRAALFGRAPVVFDLELAFGLFGYLDDDVPDDLVSWRHDLFAGAAHHYWDQRDIADRVPESTLRLTPAAVRSRLGEWRTLVRA
jgi:hypothetical protein